MTVNYKIRADLAGDRRTPEKMLMVQNITRRRSRGGSCTLIPHQSETELGRAFTFGAVVYSQFFLVFP